MRALLAAPARLRGARDESASALLEFIWLAVLLLVPVVWIVLSVFEVQRGSFGVATAARAAGRAFVLAPDEASAQQRAEAAARVALTDQGVTGAPVDVEVRCSLGRGRCLDGTSVVTVRVRSRVDLPLLPSVLGGGAPTFALSASHTLPVGQYVERQSP